MNYYYPYGEPPQSSYYQLGSEDYGLKIRQQPKDALLAQDGKEKNRKPVDPPPIIEVTVREGADPIRQYLQSPYLFMCCSLVPPTGAIDDPAQGDERALCGTMVSSLHKLKDIDNRDGGFFVFGDVSVKRVGEHRLLFSLFELQKETLQVVYLQSVLSETFIVHPQKEYPGLEESTHLSRAFADQGVKLRLRKEARTMGGPSGRKRSHTYTSQSQPQPGPSRTSLPAPESGSYGSSVSGSYGEYSESGSKRHRSGDSGRYSGYGTPVQQSGPFGGPPGVYQPQQSGSRLPTQAPVPSQAPSSAQARWPQFYGPETSPGGAPAPSSDFTYRSTPSYPAQHSSSNMSLPGYERSGQLGYGSQQQIYSSLPHGAPSASESPSTYPQQPHSYSNIPESTGYSSYSQTPQYRSDQAYGSLSRDTQSGAGGLLPQQQLSQGLPQLQQPYGSPGQPQHGYSEEGQGYQGSYDPQGRTGYPPSSRNWQ